jgi:hypothetical protein
MPLQARSFAGGAPRQRDHFKPFPSRILSSNLALVRELKEAILT